MDAIIERNDGADAAELADRRRHERIGVMWMATLRVPRGYFDCMIIDLSLGGARIAHGETLRLEIGDRVTLDLGSRGTFRAETVWKRGGYAGVRFVDPSEIIAKAFGGLLPA